MPVYNAEEYLAPCIQSILDQTYEGFFLVLVDDGSTDGSAQICNEFVERDNRITVLSQENKGAAAARNRGIEWALTQTGVEYLAFVDSDDWVHPDYLLKLYEGIASTGCKLSICCAERTEVRDYHYHDESGVIEVKTPEYLWCKDRNLCVVPWGKLYSIDLFQTIRFPEYAKAEEDEFVSFRVLFACEKICFIQSRLYSYYQSTESVMRSRWTPKRMIGFDAEEEQLDFFYTNGYREALHEAVNTYIYSMHEVLKYIEPLCDDREYYACSLELKRRINRIHHLYFKVYKFPISGNEWVYAFKHPFVARILLHARRLIERLGRKTL